MTTSVPPQSSSARDSEKAYTRDPLEIADLAQVEAQVLELVPAGHDHRAARRRREPVAAAELHGRGVPGPQLVGRAEPQVADLGRADRLDVDQPDARLHPGQQHRRLLDAEQVLLAGADPLARAARGRAGRSAAGAAPGRRAQLGAIRRRRVGAASRSSELDGADDAEATEWRASRPVRTGAGPGVPAGPVEGDGADRRRAARCAGRSEGCIGAPAGSRRRSSASGSAPVAELRGRRGTDAGRARR